MEAPELHHWQLPPAL